MKKISKILTLTLLIAIAGVVYLVQQGGFLKLISQSFSLKPQEATAQTTLNFYVATDGNDGNPGTLASPFKTLEKARDAIRAQRGVSATVWIRGGTYQLTQSFALTSQDSGTADAPITYQNYNNEEVHIIGGKKLTPGNWKIVQSGAIKDRLRTPAKSAVYQIDLKNDEGLTLAQLGTMALRPMQLFFDKTPQTLARYPNTGWLLNPSADNVPPYVQYSGPDLDWMSRPIDDIWLYGFWNYHWYATHQKISTIDVLTNTMTMVGTPQYGYVSGTRYRYDNVLEELDSAGEYYIDRTAGILYFWPPSDVTLKDSYVSILDTPLITIDDCNYITIRGLILEYARETVVKADTCNHVLVDNCIIRNLSGATNWSIDYSWAIWFIHSSNCGVSNSKIYDLGDGAIYLQGGTITPLALSGNFAKNNTIHDIGQWNMSALPPVEVDGVGITVAHNLIYNTPHLAIELNGNYNIVEFNEIHNVCLETSDAGAIYAHGGTTETGNIVRYNYIHDMVDLYGVGVYDVYLDNSQAGFQIYGNIFDNSLYGVFVNHGLNNIIANNVFVNTTGVWMSTLGTVDTGNKLLCNILYSPKTAHSLYTNGSASLYTIKNNWVKGDPLFINYEAKDFSLQESSDLWKMGWKKIPIADIGTGSTAVGVDWTFDNLPDLTPTVRTLKSSFRDGLILYLPMDEGYGKETTADRSGIIPPNNGTLKGGVSWLGSNLGKLGNGVSVDGVPGSYVTVGSPSSLTTQSARTVSFWMKTTNVTGQWRFITSFAEGGYGGFFLDLLNNPALFLNDNNKRTWGSAVPYLDGNWHHWCYYITGVGQDDIVNAVLKIDNNIITPGTTVHTSTIAPWTAHRIGASINASIDEVMIWNRVLTDAEITDLYNLNIFQDSPTQTPNITLTKSADKTQASVGEEITYTITYNNTGAGQATNVVITDVIPTGTTYVTGSANNGGTMTGTTLTWTIASVSAGGSGSVNFKVKVE